MRHHRRCAHRVHNCILHSTTTLRYDVTAVVVSLIDAACNGLPIGVTLTAAAGATALGMRTAINVTPGGTTTVTFATPVSANAVTGVHVLISG